MLQEANYRSSVLWTIRSSAFPTVNKILITQNQLSLLIRDKLLIVDIGLLSLECRKPLHRDRAHTDHSIFIASILH